MEERIKRGTARADGKVLWRYVKGEPKYISKSQYDKMEETRKAYVRMCHARYKARQAAKPPTERNYIGKYDHHSGLYFIGITSSGKEMWGTKAKLEAYRNRLNLRRKEFKERNKTNVAPTAKFGDPHPTKHNLFVILIVGSRIYYGSKKRIERIKESRAISYRLRNLKWQNKRRMLLSGLAVRYRRGDRHPTLDLMFWEYTQYAKEKWLPPAEFAIRRQSEIERRKRYRTKSAHRPDLSHS